MSAAKMDWEARVGVTRMRVVPNAPSSERRVSLGAGEAALRTRDHAAIVYWDSNELIETMVPYLVEGLRAGDKVVYVAHDHAPDVVVAALRSAGVDVDADTKAGKLMIVTAEQAFYPNGRFDVEAALKGVKELAAAAARDGFPRVRFSVEMTYLLADVPGMEKGGPEFESRANDEVFAQFPFVCICSFNGRRDEGGALEDVLATHPILLANGIPLVNPHYKPWKELQAEGRAG